MIIDPVANFLNTQIMKNVVYTTERQYLMRNKEDPRYQKTHKLLRESLMELCKEKSYDKITINEITDQAQINRSTFYLHYPDILALANDCLMVGVTLKEEYPSKNEIILDPENLIKRTTRFLRFCSDHSNFISTITSELFVNPYLKDFYEANLQIQYCFQKALFTGDLTKFIPDDRIARFIMAGQARLLGDWLDKNACDPLEQLAIYHNVQQIKVNCGLLGATTPDWVKTFN